MACDDTTPEKTKEELRERQEAREAKFREDVRESVQSFNRLIERAGVFGEEFQDWDI